MIRRRDDARLPVIDFLGQKLPDVQRAGPTLAPLSSLLRQADARLSQPMRLAVVGQIKRGKSTLVNALLRTTLAPTGDMELTFTVTEFRHSDSAHIIVHYRDGTTATALPLSKLEELTSRLAGDPHHLARISRVECGLPSPLLHSFHVVDTPGLGSVHLKDSANTSEYLGLRAEGGLSGDADPDRSPHLSAAGRRAVAAQSAADSETELCGADALLYLFSRGLHEQETATLSEFDEAPSDAVTPLRAFGVLSRCDQYWPPGDDLRGAPDPLTFDPITAAQKIADRYCGLPRVRRLFLTVLPVAGLVASGATALSADHLTWLADLARLEPLLLVRRLRDAGRFATAEQIAGTSLPARCRQELVSVIGVWGIHLACRYLREQMGEQQLRQQLRTDSGVTTLQELIVRHFGNRSRLIKLDLVGRDVAAEIGRLRQQAQENSGALPPVVDEVADTIDWIQRNVYGFAELSAVSACYRSELLLTPEEGQELLRVTGEHGTECTARVGLAPGAAPSDVAAEASRRTAYWATREQDPTIAGPTLEAVRLLRRTYALIRSRALRPGAVMGDLDALSAPEGALPPRHCVAGSERPEVQVL